MQQVRSKIKIVMDTTSIASKILVKGWVRTKRESKNVVFIALNDGSTIHNLQIVADPQQMGEEVLRQINTGACIAVQGTLAASQGKGQSVELLAENIEILGLADPEVYPLQPKRHSLEFLREIAHLRPRTNTFGAIFRLRHAMAFATHQFFNDRGFYYLHAKNLARLWGCGTCVHTTRLDARTSWKGDDAAAWEKNRRTGPLAIGFGSR
jgi:asparaginyl-tRNA synthetase